MAPLKKIAFGIMALAVGVALSLASGYFFIFGAHLPTYRDNGLWVSLKTDDPHLSRSMRLALQEPAVAVSGKFTWHEIAPGFQVGELPALVHGNVVDRIMLTRIDPTRFRFSAYDKPGGYRSC